MALLEKRGAWIEKNIYVTIFQNESSRHTKKS